MGPRKSSSDILRNGGSAAPTPPSPPPPPLAAHPPSPSSTPTTSFSDGVANNISFNKPAAAAAAGAENNVGHVVDQNTRSALRTPERSRDVLMRAREIMSVDPSAPSALNLIGSKVDMKVEFKVHYDTKLGEDLYVIGSHDKLGAWDQTNAVAMKWGAGGNWSVTVDLPAGGVMFYKYVVQTIDRGFKWQDGANNLLVLPDPWDIPQGSVFVQDDHFSGLTKQAQNQLAVKLIQTEKEKTQLRMEANKAKEMTKAALQELLLAREELREAQEKLEHYERNVQTVISSMSSATLSTNRDGAQSSEGSQQRF